ncbi:glycerophosphodiester phosphodiesterase family protein [Chondromyces apiculatus]|uniref:Glycerophosphodiester phosphodiesterase n=1 Tax=Chondromyces apiculatus DSM 436 TaxID=1192034 RepID=A0A017T7Y3_9BACT|nr:glycerophosphodiester phosphodiesterase family protein [Chondromyces apiculatus]EYF04920.1 glycerophosphodiester phosphodiesterase [Chondromyces apiculatus DSM 436]
MLKRHLSSIALSCVLLACGGDPAPQGSSAGGGGGAGGAGGSTASPPLDPALFDCTADGVPERVSPLPPACALDLTCAERLVTGHRGVGGELGVIAPENTLAAVRAAIALGVDFVETDPRATADGVLVNVHDTSVDGTTTGTGNVDAMSLAEVQALGIEADKYAGDFSCERVATMEEVLLAARGRVHVLLDANKTDRMDLLVEVIRATDTLDWAIVDTDEVEKIDEALALEPELLTMIRVSEEAELTAELAHFSAHPPVIVEVNDNGPVEDLVPLIHAAGHRAMTDSFVIDLAAGFGDDPGLYEEAFATGVDIVQTERPDLLLRYLGR